MSDWNKNWKRSEQPAKQRKYRANAPYHIRKKFLSAHLSESLQERVGTSSLPVREGDKAEIMRGDWAGLSGRVDRIDYDNYKVYLDGIEQERVDTTEAKAALDPSNLKLTKLELDDERRLAKYEISEEDREEIRAEDEAEESEDEDEATAEEADEEAPEDEEESGDAGEETDDDTMDEEKED
ncbi:MAG: 50S ribosomal protein L24 [Candidatus Nanohaloarchaea archaeon]|nr:50S ribosomal protein L24 [Candidatus Nanohaloarchaea archaeon]